MVPIIQVLKMAAMFENAGRLFPLHPLNFTVKRIVFKVPMVAHLILLPRVQCSSNIFSAIVSYLCSYSRQVYHIIEVLNTSNPFIFEIHGNILNSISIKIHYNTGFELQS